MRGRSTVEMAQDQRQRAAADRAEADHHDRAVDLGVDGPVGHACVPARSPHPGRCAGIRRRRCLSTAAAHSTAAASSGNVEAVARAPSAEGQLRSAADRGRHDLRQHHQRRSCARVGSRADRHCSPRARRSGRRAGIGSVRSARRSRPSPRDSAPYFIAFVVSSCSARPIYCAAFGRRKPFSPSQVTRRRAAPRRRARSATHEVEDARAAPVGVGQHVMGARQRDRSRPLKRLTNCCVE